MLLARVQLHARDMLATMLAARYLTCGPRRGVLELCEMPQPRPARGEVRVRVAISGVNPTDWKARRPGGLGSGESDSVVPNQDGAGTIDAVGEGVDGSRVGERVWLHNAQWRRAQGSAAQWIALPSEQAVALPDTASFELGASLGIPAMTAHRCLSAGGPPEPGEQLLVHGGAGAVGHAAIELARHAGARVAATVSSAAKARLAVDAGAELVIDYRTESVVEAVRAWAPNGVARVIEIDLARNLEIDAQLLGDGGSISSYAATESAVLPPRRLMVLNAEVRFVLVYTMPEAAKRDAVAAITSALGAGHLTTLPLTRFPLEAIASAHDAVEGGAVGKVLVDVP